MPSEASSVARSCVELAVDRVRRDLGRRRRARAGARARPPRSASRPTARASHVEGERDEPRPVELAELARRAGPGGAGGARGPPAAASRSARRRSMLPVSARASLSSSVAPMGELRERGVQRLRVLEHVLALGAGGADEPLGVSRELLGLAALGRRLLLRALVAGLDAGVALVALVVRRGPAIALLKRRARLGQGVRQLLERVLEPLRRVRQPVLGGVTRERVLRGLGELRGRGLRRLARAGEALLVRVELAADVAPAGPRLDDGVDLAGGERRTLGLERGRARDAGRRGRRRRPARRRR